MLYHKLLADIPSSKGWLVAFSGGLDSTVLLHLLVSQTDRPPMRALHINHQLNASANDWQSHAEAVCAALGIECVSITVDLGDVNSGLEEAARVARYQVFEEHLGPNELLLMGHHQNDQAETLMLRLLRGAGVRGMAAMPAARPLGRGALCRPLLGCTRTQLQRYAEQKELTWVEDTSNSDSRFDRNYLRNEVLPLLAQRWPEFASSWSHSSAAAREAIELLDELAQQDLPTLNQRTEAYGVSVDLAAFQRLSKARRRNVLHTVLADNGFDAIPRAQSQELFTSLLTAAKDATPVVEWARHSVRRYRDRVFFLRQLPAIPQHFNSSTALSASNGLHSVDIDGLCRLDFEFIPGHQVGEEDAQITIRFRQGGERLAVSESLHKTLKNWLQEQAVPPWIRERQPLIFVGSSLCAVGDLWQHPKVLRSVSVDWYKNPSFD